MTTEDVIVIPTHIAAIKFLENLLESFRGFDKYPVLVIVNEYRKKDSAQFLDIKQRFRNLPISIMPAKGNNFNFGGLYCAYFYTGYKNIFLLPGSCEIVDTDLFDIVFEKYRDKSVAFALMDHAVTKDFWHSEVGKFRRSVLDKIDLPAYLPSDWVEACATEIFFSSRYHSLDKDAVVLFPDWVDCDVFEEKFGKLRMKIANEYIIKWKSHWNMGMVFDHIKKDNLFRYLLYKLRLKIFQDDYNDLFKQLYRETILARSSKKNAV